MKKIGIVIFFLLLLRSVFGDELQDMLMKANTAYARGSYYEAVSLLDMASANYAADFESKSSIADSYNEIGQKEYYKNNYLNAYECFRKAVKIYPTHKAASENFWKMKKNFDVANLRNEGPLIATTTTSSDSSTTGDMTDKLEKAEDMLAELEKNKTMDYSSADSAEIKRYKEELTRQSELIKELQRMYRGGSQTTVYQDAASKEILDNLVKLYENALKAKEGNSDIDILASQMKDYRIMFEQQQSGQMNLVLIFIISFSGLIISIILTVLILYRIARKRQRQRFAYATNYDMGLGYDSPLGLEEKQARFIGYEESAPNTESKEAQKEGTADKDVYQDMVRDEHLKEMYNEKKYGALKWETVKEYISNLEKELRSEILYVVETKINSGDLEDYTQILPVLFPFLTDSDDYMRDKAQHLLISATESFTKEEATHTLLEYDEEQKKEPGVALSISALMKHIDKLKYTKTARGEHCINTAKYARGMADMLNLPKEMVDLVYKSALVHDIGYLLLDKDKLADIGNKKEYQRR